MFYTILITLLVVTICFGLLGIKVSFTKDGGFPNGHVSGSKALRERGISRAQSQDRETQKKRRSPIDETEKTLNGSMNQLIKKLYFASMKRMDYLVNGFAALALLFLFSQYAGKADNTATPAASGNANATSDLKAACVEVGILLSQYNFCKDLNVDIISREENSRVILNQKANELRKSQQEFQKKYESNAFISPEGVQQEYTRLGKLEQDLQALQNKLAAGMASENAKNSRILRDSINAFLKEYNKTKGYNLIINNTSFGNLLYADSTLNIAKEIVGGFNVRYTPMGKKQNPVYHIIKQEKQL